MTDQPDAQVWHVSGQDLLITHPDRLIWPEDGLSKGDLLAYYRDLAPVMLPHFADRPVTLRSYPETIHGPAVYQRDVSGEAPDWLRVAEYTGKTTDRTIQVPLVDSAAGLLWLANTGAVEFHLWNARAPEFARPDQAMFDLDPGEHATFPDVLRTALAVREALEQQGLRGYPKTSGRTGLHVLVPLEPVHPQEVVRAWVRGVAEQLAAQHPGRIAVARGATHTGNSVTIDYAQNSIARNLAAPYTVRAAPGAPVATPLTWDEVADGQVRPLDFTLRTVPERVASHGDLFAPVLGADQQLSA